MASASSRQRVRRRAGERGFTLIELMVVVILVGILAVLATPALLDAQRSRRAYEDAATIMMLFKNARTRAIGDQAAVTIVLNFDNSGSKQGIFQEFEATYGSSANNVAGGQAAMSACTYPSVWKTSMTETDTSAIHPVLIEGYNMQEGTDSDARVHLFVTTQSPSGSSVAVNTGQFAYCFTPSGRMYTASGSTAGSNPTFTTPTMAPALFTVKRDDGTSSTSYKGPSRNVLVMPSGATRLYSS